MDFFQQQDQVEDEGLPTLGHQDGDAGKSSEEEEALDPLGIMRYVSPSGWGALHLACSGLLPLSWGSEKTHLPRSSLSTQGDWLSVHPQHLLGLWGWAQVSPAPPWSQGGPPAFYRGLAGCHPNPDTSAAQASSTQPRRPGFSVQFIMEPVTCFAWPGLHCPEGGAVYLDPASR